ITFHQLYDILHFDAFTADSVHLKKPSVARRAFLNPPSKYVNHEGHEGHEGKRESKKNSFCL
ncbi:MAG: hypothetical protein PVH61_12200, partial [Candidatus Aminicenantes bacterium]